MQEGREGKWREEEADRGEATEGCRMLQLCAHEAAAYIH